MRSLSARLLVAVSILLLIALSITALILDQIFRTAAEEATEERLNTQLILLMSSADIDEQGQLEMPEVLPEARFMAPGSGLFGFVSGPDGLYWKSLSAVGIISPDVNDSVTGQNTFKKITFDDKDYFQNSIAIEWEISGNTYKSFVFTTAESLEPYSLQLKQFRTRLFSWFAFLIACIVFAQALLMRWVLKPLRKIAHEVMEIDHGKRDLLSHDYPSELLGVTTNTNALIQAERSRMERYQSTLGNLAHSLKTPLAVIHTSTEKADTDKELIRRQVKIMNDIVGYQLKRAATVGQITLGREPILVEPVINDLIAALSKVYFDKGLQFTCNIQADLLFYGDRGDLTEVIGNLLDNAAKWSRTHVSIQASKIETGLKRYGLHLVVEDDGKGIDEEQKLMIMKRGQRADESIPGYGIGLAIIKEVVQSYQGTIVIEDSKLGGARFEIRLPII